MKTLQPLILLLCAIALFSPSCQAHAGQDDDRLTLTVENDAFGSGADRNYTSGVRLTWLEHDKHPSAATRALNHLVPFEDMLNDSTVATYSIGQSMFTPKTLNTSTPATNDRPYAGFLYATGSIASTHENRTDQFEFTGGIVGPGSLAHESQRFIHTLIDGVRPEGWSHQLHNEPGLMISGQRMWNDAAHAEYGALYLGISPYAGATLGNIMTYGNAGVVVQLLPSKYKQHSTPQRIRPALPGNSYAAIPDGEFSWCVFAGAEGRAVGHNIFLDGNTFQDSPSVDKKPFVMDANAGIAFDLGRTQLSYTITWRSEEFYGQDNTDLFGSVGLSYRF